MHKKRGVWSINIVQKEGFSVRIRRSTCQDLEMVYHVEHNTENSKFIIPWSKEQHSSSLDNSDIAHFIIETVTDSKPVGYTIIAGLQNKHNSIELMRVTVIEKGMGYGKESVGLIKKWAFEDLNAHRLWLDVKECNLRAKHVYESQGFKLEGTLRECLKAGDTYESLHIMSILKHEYL